MRTGIAQHVTIATTAIRPNPVPEDGERRTRRSPLTVTLLESWRRHLRYQELPARLEDWVFCNTKGRSLNPESVSQLFDRVVRRSGLPRIRFHDLRHTHASLLVADGAPIKVVAERLGHAHPGFTMNTYQHVLPGMQADAAARFAKLLEPRAGD